MSKGEDAVAFEQGEIIRQVPTCASRVKTNGTRHGGIASYKHAEYQRVFFRALSHVMSSNLDFQSCLCYAQNAFVHTEIQS